ncbi:hypothetical protein PMAYCL1PPCAC_05681, partial [Pristionchus mayeri]
FVATFVTPPTTVPAVAAAVLTILLVVFAIFAKGAPIIGILTSGAVAAFMAVLVRLATPLNRLVPLKRLRFCLLGDASAMED